MLKRKEWQYKTIAGQPHRKRGKRVQAMWLQEWCDVPAAMWNFDKRQNQ